MVVRGGSSPPERPRPTESSAPSLFSPAPTLHPAPANGTALGEGLQQALEEGKKYVHGIVHQESDRQRLNGEVSVTAKLLNSP